MKISRRHLSEILGERTLHIKDGKELAKEVAAYLLQSGQSADLESLLRDIMHYRAEHGVIEAYAVSAHELSPAMLKEVEDLLRKEYPHAKAVIVHEQHDPSVVGGVRIRLADEQLDLTVRARLNTLKRLTALERK